MPRQATPPSDADRSHALQALEADFQHSHQQLVHQTLTGPDDQKRPVAPPTDQDDDEAFLDMLALKLAQRAGQFLAEPETMAHYLKHQELLQDNQRMAVQIDRLLKVMQEQKKVIETLRGSLKEQQQTYLKLFGRFYLHTGSITPGD